MKLSAGQQAARGRRTVSGTPPKTQFLASVFCSCPVGPLPQRAPLPWPHFGFTNGKLAHSLKLKRDVGRQDQEGMIWLGAPAGHATVKEEGLWGLAGLGALGAALASALAPTISVFLLGFLCHLDFGGTPCRTGHLASLATSPRDCS